MIRARLALLGVLLYAAPALAQTPQPPVEPSEPARAQLGPVSIRPALILREVGYDSNVLHQSEDGEGDFTATFGARVDVGFRSSRVRGSYSGFYEYLYFASFEAERGANGGADARLDFTLERVRPYVSGGITRSHERPTSEIDARASRLVSNVAAGTTVAAGSRTSLHVGVRQSDSEFDEDETFRGVGLADQLNGASRSVLYGADFVLSPLTTISVHGEHAQDRFDTSGERDANSYRYGVTATMQPLALISGRASIGVRAFRPLNAVVPDFTGLTAAIAVSYALHEDTRVGLTFDRDLRYSFAEETPYYVSTGGRLTLTHRLFGDFDGQVFGGFERIGYEARVDASQVPDGSDNIRIVGGGFGYRLGDGSRVGINLDYATRTSPAPDREYSRGRVYATVTYGF